MRAIWRRPDNSTVIGLSPLGNWILRSTTHSALQSTILGFLYFEHSSNPCLQAFGQTCAGFYIVTLRFRIVDTPSIASERNLVFSWTIQTRLHQWEIQDLRLHFQKTPRSHGLSTNRNYAKRRKFRPRRPACQNLRLKPAFQLI